MFIYFSLIFVTALRFSFAAALAPTAASLSDMLLLMPLFYCRFFAADAGVSSASPCRARLRASLRAMITIIAFLSPPCG
jgi:hypothetical protein